MIRASITGTTLMLAAFGTVWFAAPAHAYIDGGTASMLFQMMMAGIIASLFFVKTWWYNLKYFIARMMGKVEPTDTSVVEETSPLDE